MFFEQPGREWDVTRQSKLASVAVVSVSFKPSGASTKDARGRGIGQKGAKKPFCPMPSRVFRACPAWLKGNGNDCYAGKKQTENGP